ncbi:sarcosine dehydrogenase, mitochondrial [Anopheles maculipalpis]|uniref:sarcosine dehydrogenase, mitochondrial n=1 Tax=Anopheles maculipalpis TaxID=1496333 RepID=UPI0021599F86|nr:sarcosine dehydrogenase, mitochondrial [Anopheles maculipalpis]
MLRLRTNAVAKFKSHLFGGDRRSAISAASIPTVSRKISTESPVPESADVVIIGGGSAGCNTLYQLAKRGVRAVLLEKSKLTAGTTWHTAGLVWRLRPNDVEIRLLAATRDLLMSLEEETGQNSGWINNGGLFISHSPERLDEYSRLATLGKCFGIESHIISPEESQKLFPALDPSAFTGALYSPGDGVVDPAMMCTALTKGATANGGRVIEDCTVTQIVTGENLLGMKDVRGVMTNKGTIRTNTVVNATGVWGRDLIEPLGVFLPLIPMKHAYVVSETMDTIHQMLPNVRDHDFSLYFRIQGKSICMGGYENNPILLNRVPGDFHFGLYDLDYSVFDTHIQGAVKLCPAFGSAGIKSTICGPESFTPDHKPLMGPDPTVSGLFHSVGYNSAGMMLGGGCAEQLAKWIINERPDRHMFAYDVRRFTPKQKKALNWATERSHEAYTKNYSIVFPHDEPLAGRNFTVDPFHKQMIQYGAVMEERHGWERPGYFLPDETVVVQPYDWYGFYDHPKNANTHYEEALKGDYTFGFSEHHDLIGEEALTCRHDAALFNLSYFSKLFLTGSQAKEAAEWIFTANLDKPINKTVYTCALNKQGGVEGDVTISIVESGLGGLHDPIFKGRGYYIVAGGASAYHTKCHILAAIQEKAFRAVVSDHTEELGVLSLQGPKSRDILQKITDFDLSNEQLLPMNSTAILTIKINPHYSCTVRVLRVSFVGELGYELHIPEESCNDVYNALMKAGYKDSLRNAGYRALYSLSSEKGYHLWGFDLRSDDTPIEANLGFVCRKNGEYQGKEIVDRQRENGVSRRLAFFTLREQVPIWGLEAVYRDGEIVGHLRRGEYGYTLQKPIGQAYVQRSDGSQITNQFLQTGHYQIEVMGKKYDADCHLRSPFDPKGERLLGIYK